MSPRQSPKPRISLVPLRSLLVVPGQDLGDVRTAPAGLNRRIVAIAIRRPDRGPWHRRLRATRGSTGARGVLVSSLRGVPKEPRLRQNQNRAECPFGAVRVRRALMCGSELDSAKLVGGSEADRQRVLERMHEYLGINARFDWRHSPELWSAAPEAVFFVLVNRAIFEICGVPKNLA